MRVLILAAFALAGCATQAVGNSEGGIISNHGWSQSRSFNQAEAHCQQYGKHARVTGTNDLEATLTFACI